MFLGFSSISTFVVFPSLSLSEQIIRISFDNISVILQGRMRLDITPARKYNFRSFEPTLKPPQFTCHWLFGAGEIIRTRESQQQQQQLGPTRRRWHSFVPPCVRPFTGHSAHVDGHFVFMYFGMAFPFSMCFETWPKLGPGRFLAMFWKNANPKHNKWKSQF